MPLVVLYFIGIAALVSKLISEWAELLASFTVVLALNVVYQIATILFLGLMLTLFVVRRLPKNYAKGVLPRAAAIIGANLQLLFLALPRVQNSFPVLVASTIVTVIGLVGSIYIAAFLGRSFSILPQARGLVTTGPYRLVRHPLYIAEFIALFGIIWQFAQPWAFFIVIAIVAAQFLRMHYEEKVLAETYPAYRSYMLRTGRLFPRAFVSGSSFYGNGLNGSIAIDASNSSPLVE
jgi:protein-S-isoprenylcysteine O-methyltransferase Ste14